MIIIFKLKNEFGEFVSEELNVSLSQYQTILEMSKSFYEGGYEMHLPNGFMVVPPEVVKKSILIIEVISVS
jgi:hypothetical protein